MNGPTDAQLRAAEVLLLLGSMDGFARATVKRMADYESYLVSAQACGVSMERARAIFEEESLKPGAFASWLQAAKNRIYSGEESSA